MRVPTYRFGEFELDPAARELRREGGRVSLPPKSFDCLVYLISHRERAVGRDELIAAVWGRVDITDTVVSQTMLRARKALGDSGESAQRMVRTVPRFGYHWVAPVVASAHGNDSDRQAQAAREAPGVTDDALPATHTRSRTWRRALAATVIAIGVSGAALFAFHMHRNPAPIATSPSMDVLVMPVRVMPADIEDAWVRLGAMDYIANRLRQGRLRVVPSEQALHLGQQLRGMEPFGENDIRQLQRVRDVRWVVAPQAERDARGWRVRLVVSDGARELPVEARGTSLLNAVAAAVDSWMRRVHPDRMRREIGPSGFDQRVQQIDAELLAGQLEAARRLIESATTDERADPALRVREGQVAFRTGQLDEASALFKRTLATTRLTPDVRARALMGQGAIEIRRGHPDRARVHYANAVAVARSLGPTADPALAGNAHNGLGVALVQQGRMDEAVREMNLARVAMQRSGNVIEAASVGTNLGILEQQRRHYPQALVEFDRAIAVFERYGVNDYMAAALMAKAAAQLDMVRPDAAAASIARAHVSMSPIDDQLLSARVAMMSAKIALARGRLREAAHEIDRLRGLDVPDDDSVLRELRLRLHLARGADKAAAAIARAPVDSTSIVPGSLALAASEALLASHDDVTTTRWIAYGEHVDAARRGLDWDIAAGLLAQFQMRTDDALALANTANARVEQTGSPEERVQAGLFKARLLRAQGKPEAAAPVLADLDAFATSDYRVAWETHALYRALHDEAMARIAWGRVQALRGERDTSVVPAL